MPNGVERNDKAESVVNNTGINVIYGGDRAYYSPAVHDVHMPEREQFKTTNGFYSTLFHELGHANFG